MKSKSLLKTPEFLQQVYKNCTNVALDPVSSKDDGMADFYAVEDIQVEYQIIPAEDDLPSSLCLEFRIKHLNGKVSYASFNAPSSHAEAIRKLARKMKMGEPVKPKFY